ncbi:MAG: thioredoxin family protein [Thiobacillus sp.]|nr:thioredoxin family protein [Thiobacillus sp.]
MIERLLGILGLLLTLWFVATWFRIRQRAIMDRQAPPMHDGIPLLLTVVSRHCAVCPAQKRIVAELGARYSATRLKVILLDAEAEPERVRALSVMTVPTTLLFTAGGTVAHVNNGLVGLEALMRQIDGLPLTQGK